MRATSYNACNPFGLAVVTAAGRARGKTSYVLCHQPKSFDWRARGAKPHLHGKLADAAFAEACTVLDRIVGIMAGPMPMPMPIADSQRFTPSVSAADG